jgi:hypothetical protein
MININENNCIEALRDFENNVPKTIVLNDHLKGFDSNYKNPILDSDSNLANQNNTNIEVNISYMLDGSIKLLHPNLTLTYRHFAGMDNFFDYNQHPELTFQNFLCSFNGGEHVGRKMLVAVLKRFKYWNNQCCSKNFTFSSQSLQGHITEMVDKKSEYYLKFFISSDSENFFQSINSFGHLRYDHVNNIYNLEHKITQSFLHLVSETLPTSYVPFVTEKFLYSIVTRGLFLAYAQPGWHSHLEKYYGFKRYTKLFDYEFDRVSNPVERLLQLMSMISKFKNMSSDDWRDLYLLEQDTVEYNYNHYFSRSYKTCLKNYIDIEL